MLRIIQNSSAVGAKSYYSTADYYSEGQELVGRWCGKGARRLGLFGDIAQPTWDALCDNRDPQTGNTLTLRQKNYRRIGYDFNFHVPKSLSLLYTLTQDERLLDAFRASVHDTMQDMEHELQTRVRKGGLNEDRTTGNMVWGEFVHFTSRPVDGLPDPHLHAHCFVFNVTWDQQEQAWKAGQFSSLKRDAPYFEAVFHSRLTRRLAELGLAVERTRAGWELAGFGPEIVEKFSRRTAQIEAEARKRGIEDPEAKSELGAKTRQRKVQELTMPELRQEWLSRLTDDERENLQSLERRIGSGAIPEDAARATEAVQQAADHWFERKSVVPERTLLAESLRRAVGRASVVTVEHAYRAAAFVNGDLDGRRMATTRAVLQEERDLVHFARAGRGTCRPLAAGPHAFQRAWLNDSQRRAVAHVLGSSDRVILIRGAAGVGKTSMMQEAVGAIEAHGTKVFTFAPSATASRGTLRDEGFDAADTVARLLIDEKLHQQARGQVLWVDEAGLLGSRTTAQLFALADRLDARVVLSGDRRQHASVERGSPLRMLEQQAGLVPAEIKEIQRQRGAYKQAIHALSEGDLPEGFRQLDQLGWIREVPPEERYQVLAAEYLDALAAGKTALIVSPTHREAERITAEIRARRKARGQLGTDERRFRTLENAHFTPGERADPVQHTPGDVLVFHQNAKGFQKGQQVTVGSAEKLPLDQAARFQVFHPGELTLAAGNWIRITQNGQTADGRHRLNNGALYRVDGFDRDGNLLLQNGWTVGKDFGFLDSGYAVTSHAAQGKTIDRVFVGQSAESYAASSPEQFYVSCSRGREAVTVYTVDKDALLDAVQRSDSRWTATDLVTGAHLRERVQTLQRQPPEPPRDRPARSRTFVREELVYE